MVFQSEVKYWITSMCCLLLKLFPISPSLLYSTPFSTPTCSHSKRINSPRLLLVNICILPLNAVFTFWIICDFMLELLWFLILQQDGILLVSQTFNWNYLLFLLLSFFPLILKSASQHPHQSKEDEWLLCTLFSIYSIPQRIHL